MALSRDEILSLKFGETVDLGDRYVIVQSIDKQRSEVSGLTIIIDRTGSAEGGLLRVPNDGRIYGATTYDVKALMQGRRVTQWQS